MNNCPPWRISSKYCELFVDFQGCWGSKRPEKVSPSKINCCPCRISTIFSDFSRIFTGFYRICRGLYGIFTIFQKCSWISSIFRVFGLPNGQQQWTKAKFPRIRSMFVDFRLQKWTNVSPSAKNRPSYGIFPNFHDFSQMCAYFENLQVCWRLKGKAEINKSISRYDQLLF